MIKWIVVGLLVAGTFGVIWNAPWKDDVERITDDVQQKVSQARATVAVLNGATDGGCAKVGTDAPSDVREAVATIVAETRRNPDAMTLTPSGQGALSVREVASRQAVQIGECIMRLPKTGAGWIDLQADLERAAERA